MVRLAAVLLLLAPAAAAGAGRTALLRVSAEVRRSITVSVDGAGANPTLRVRTAQGAVRAVPLAEARSAGARLEPAAAGPGWVVVTVLADAPAADR